VECRAVVSVATYCGILQAGMGDIRGTFESLQDEIDAVVDYMVMVRDKKKSLKRLGKKNLRVQVILNCALREAVTRLVVKLRQ
jgi:hypothetical protein